MLDLDKLHGEVLTWLKPIGDMILQGLTNDQKQTKFKSSSIDYLTEYDIKSEAALVEKIKQTYPTHAIIGEEGADEQASSQYTWVIDPIDGTTNYAHGFPFFCISIGLKTAQKTLYGIVYAPMLKFTFHAISGRAAYLNGKKITVSNTSDIAKSLIATGFPYCRAEDNMNLPYFLKIVNHVSGIRRCGSAALDLCMVAAGMTDAYWEFYLNEWDVIAGRLIVEEAGGRTEQIKIDDYTMTLASNQNIYHELRRRLLEPDDVPTLQ